MTVLALGNTVLVTQHITPVSLTASAGTPTAQDLKGSTWGIININMGVKAGTTSIYTFTVEESADNAAFTTAKKWVDGEVSTTDADYAVTATPGTTDDQNVMIAFDTGHLERYVRVTCVLSGGGSDAFPVAVTIITMPNYTGDATNPNFTI